MHPYYSVRCQYTEQHSDKSYPDSLLFFKQNFIKEVNQSAKRSGFHGSRSFSKSGLAS